MILAVIKDGIVENTVAVTDETKQSTIDHFTNMGLICVEGTAVSPGDSYNNGEFIPKPPEVNKVIPKLDFMNRFTIAELESIYTAAKSNVSVEIWLDKLKESKTINLVNESVIESIKNLETLGLISAGRSEEILS